MLEEVAGGSLPGLVERGSIKLRIARNSVGRGLVKTPQLGETVG